MHATTRKVWLVIVLTLMLCGRAFATDPTITISQTGASGSGNITVAFSDTAGHAYTETIIFGPYSTPAGLAAGLAAMFTRDYLCPSQGNCSSGLGAHSVGPVITFQANNRATLQSLSDNPPGYFPFSPAGWTAGGTSSPSLAVSCGASSLTVGQTTNCTAQLSPASGPTGSIAFSVNVNGAQDLWQSSSLSSTGSAVAYDGFGALPAGTYALTASYSGDGTYGPVSSAPINITVNAATTGGTGATQSIYNYTITDQNGNSGYAPNSNILNYYDSVTGTWSNIQYDSLNRLSLATQTLAPNPAQYTCWSYDSFGNRQAQDTSNQAFTNSPGSACVAASAASLATNMATYSANNQMTLSNASGVSITPGYDKAGNMTFDGNNQYLYDAEGRVCAVMGPPPFSGGPSQMTQYLYDAEGVRVGKGNIVSWSCDTTQNGFTLTSTYILGLNNEQVTEIAVNNGVSTWKHTNVFAAGQLIATYDMAPDGTPALHFNISDWLGTKRVQTDYAGNPEEYCSSLAFGDGLNCQSTGIATADDATEHHFTGKERDTESGLDYFGARYYASNMGRFMSPDWSAKIETVPYSKLDDPQSLNLYSYVRNNPLSRRDLDGHADVAAMCKGQATCKATVTDTVNIVHYDKKTGNTVVDSTLKVTTNFNVTTDAKGNMSATASSTVSNVSGHAYSDSQLATMGKDIGAMQGAAVTMGFGANTTQLMTAVGAVETRFGAADPAKGSPSYMNPAINPMQLTGGNGANMNMMHNIDGAMGVFDWAGSPSDFDPTATYSRYSDHSVPTMANWGSTYNSISEQVQPPQQ